MTKRQKLENEILECLNEIKDYDLNYTGLLMCDLYLINHCFRISKDIEIRVKIRIETLRHLKALDLLKKELERNDWNNEEKENWIVWYYF